MTQAPRPPLTHARAMALADQLARLLRDEVAAIEQGRLGQVQELFPRKAELLEEIRAAFDGAEGLLEGEDTPARRLRDRLAEVSALVRRDLQLLERITEATGAVAREVEKIRDSRSLKGVYGRDGAARSAPVASTQRIDQSL